MDSELLLKFIGYLLDIFGISVLLQTLLRLFWTTFVKTAVHVHFSNFGIDL